MGLQHQRTNSKRSSEKRVPKNGRLATDYFDCESVAIVKPLARATNCFRHTSGVVLEHENRVS